MGNTSFILASIGVFLVVILLLVIILLVAKKYLSPSGNVNIEINGDKTINVPQGSSLMTTLNENGIFLPYIFSLKPGDKVMMSGPYGDFHPNFTSGKEMIWIGGGAGMAPLRAQIMHMTKTLHTTDRELHFFYGARALGEAFFLEDFWELEKEFPNFHFHLSLDRKDPVADAQGVKYYEGFAVNCIRDTYLKDHEAPEDCEYYLCGPPMLIKTVTDYLDSLGVDQESIMYDNFG